MPASPAAKKTSATSKKTAAKAATAKKSSATSSDVKKKSADAASKKASKQAMTVSKSKAVTAEKVKKTKVVRDSFTMPENEYQVLRDMKKACLKAGVDVKKSELLRIGVALIKSMDPAAVKAGIARLTPLKAGRPKKSQS